MGRRSRTAPAARRGFSLVEMLLAVFILAIGVISISALFPAGIVLQRQATDDLLGPIAAKNAFATVRMKLSPDDFGSFEDFGVPPAFLDPFVAGTVATSGSGPVALQPAPGDWGWMRPGVCFGTTQNTVDAGTIDVFSSAYTRAQLGFPNDVSGVVATETPDGGNAPELFGIPYNPKKFPLFVMNRSDALALNPLEQRFLDPSVTFTQSERSYPQGPANYGTSAASAPATYYWDCMFRKNGGRVQVAVFVYRVNAPGGEPRGYAVRPTPTGAGANAPTGSFNAFNTVPPIPALYRVPTTPAWNANLVDIPGTTPPAGAFGGADATWDDWQAPDAWWIDNHGSVHRVLSGRLNSAQGPVRLARPIPALPFATTNGYGGNGSIAAIWYVPRRDANNFVLTPVFAAVEGL